MDQEYYRDAPIPDPDADTPSPSTQAAYDTLRELRALAVAANWQSICADYPAIGHADASLQALLKDNPSTSFPVYRLEEMLATEKAGLPVYPR